MHVAVAAACAIVVVLTISDFCRRFYLYKILIAFVTGPSCAYNNFTLCNVHVDVNQNRNSTNGIIVIYLMILNNNGIQ